LNVVLITASGFTKSEVEQNLRRARELSLETGDATHLVPLVVGLGRFHVTRADRAATEEYMQQERLLITRSEDADGLVQLHAQLGNAELARGKLAQAREHHEQVLRLYEPEAHAALSFSFGADPKALALVYSGVRLWLSGWPDQSRSSTGLAVSHAQSIAQPFTLANVLGYAGWVLRFCGELDRAWTFTQTLSALSDEHGFPVNVTRVLLEQGSVLVLLGKLGEGIKLLTEGLTQFRAMGARLLLPYFLSSLARLMDDSGESRRHSRLSTKPST
jgi:predicted ATPase